MKSRIIGGGSYGIVLEIPNNHEEVIKVAKLGEDAIKITAEDHVSFSMEYCKMFIAKSPHIVKVIPESNIFN